jgi:uncharacterized protein YdaU (DUF1376 family)
MSTPPFVRFYANDWFTGCAGLKADERGVYVSMCVYIWTTGKRVPLDDAEASRMMNLNFKSYQRIRDRLVVIGKVTRHENGYGNDRAEHELAAAAEAAAAKGRTVATPDRGNEGRAEEAAEPRQETPKNAEANGAVLTDGPIDDGIDHRIDGTIDHAIEVKKSEPNQTPFIEPEPITRKNDVDDVARARVEVLPDGFLDRMLKAAGPVLDDPVNTAGLLMPSTPIMWLREGCSFELDVIPALESIAVARAGKSKVRDWNYFTKAVSNAKDARERKLPPPDQRSMPQTTKPRKIFATYDALMQQVTGAPAS